MTKNTFVDVLSGSSSPKWDYYSIETAARAGIVTGMENNVFAADQLLERQQAATMIARANELKLSMRGDKLDASLDKIFTDRPQIDSYARPAVEASTRPRSWRHTERPVPGPETKLSF